MLASVSSNFSLRKAQSRCPGRRISWFWRESALSTPQSPAAKEYSLRSMKRKYSSLSP